MHACPTIETSIAAPFCAIAATVQDAPHAPRLCLQSMHPRAHAAFNALFGPVLLAFAVTAHAALADDLGEVTRLHHAGQSAAVMRLAQVSRRRKRAEK